MPLAAVVNHIGPPQPTAEESGRTRVSKDGAIEEKGHVSLVYKSSGGNFCEVISNPNSESLQQLDKGLLGSSECFRYLIFFFCCKALPDIPPRLLPKYQRVLLLALAGSGLLHGKYFS